MMPLPLYRMRHWQQHAWQFLRHILLKKLSAPTFARLSLIAVGIITMIVLCLFVWRMPSSTITPTSSSPSLEHIAQQLTSLTQWQTNTAEGLERIHHQLTQLSTSSFPALDKVDTLAQTLHNVQAQLGSHLTQLQTLIDAWPTETSDKPHLDTSALPFNVIALEYWNGQAFVRIADKQRPIERLLTMNEKQGVWQVIALDPHQGHVLFQNTADELVEVILS